MAPLLYHHYYVDQNFELLLNSKTDTLKQPKLGFWVALCAFGEWALLET